MRRAISVLLASCVLLCVIGATPAVAGGERETGRGIVSSSPNCHWSGWCWIFVDHLSAMAIANQLETNEGAAISLALQSRGVIEYLAHFISITHGRVALAIRDADHGRGVVLYMYLGLVPFVQPQ